MTTKYLFKAIPDAPRAEILLEGEERISVEFVDGSISEYTAADNRIKYTDVWIDTDLTYDFGPQEIKETIIALSPDSPTTYKFRLEGFSHYNIQDGIMLFFNESHKLLYHIKKPYAILANGVMVSDINSISHSFCQESSTYSITIKEFSSDLYPIMIDPTFGFGNVDSAAETKEISAFKNAQLLLTGSDKDHNRLDFSNALEDGTLLGGDAVTFHRNTNAHLEFLIRSDEAQDIFSVKIHGKKQTTTVLDSSNRNLILTATLSPVLLFALTGDENNLNYQFKVSFSDTIKEASSVFVTADLITDVSGSAITDSSLGVITQQPTANPRNVTQYDLVYSPPPVIPEDRDSLLLRVTIAVTFTLGSKTTTINKHLYSFIQLTSHISYESFKFQPNAFKRDFINGDLYAPTSNRGLATMDISLGVVRTIDQNNGLLTPDHLNVMCAGRIGKATDNPSKGIIVCTKAGVYYYNSRPFDEPPSYRNPVRLSSKVIVDFVMVDNHLFMLEENGTIYRINYNHFLSHLANPSAADKAIDSLLNTEHNQPFHSNNFSPSPSPYQYAAASPPAKLLPISIKSDFPSANLSTVYTGGANPNWRGISVMYQDRESESKIILSIAYAPTSSAVGSTGSTDKESFYNKVVFATKSDSLGGAPYSINPIAKDDKIKVYFDFEPNKDVKPESKTYNYPILHIPPTKYANSRVVVGGLILDSTRSNSEMNRFTPDNDTYYLCPRNVSVVNVVEIGPFYDPVTGEEVI